MGKLTIDISDELIKLFPSKKEARSEAKQAMVFDLVRRGKISKGKAAELLGISLWDLPELLAQYDIPWFDYSPDDLKHDLDTLKELENKGKQLRIVCDSSTIIALERINHLWLLENLAEEILIPQAVNKEIKGKKGINLPACFRIEEAKDKLYIRQNRKNLHIGEVEAIALAKDIKADLVILDDKKARKLAEKEGLKVAGLLALVIRAKEKGIIERVKPIVDDLKRYGFFIDKNTYVEILKLSGEISD